MRQGRRPSEKTSATASQTDWRSPRRTPPPGTGASRGAVGWPLRRPQPANPDPAWPQRAAIGRAVRAGTHQIQIHACNQHRVDQRNAIEKGYATRAETRTPAGRAASRRSRSSPCWNRSSMRGGPSALGGGGGGSRCCCGEVSRSGCCPAGGAPRDFRLRRPDFCDSQFPHHGTSGGQPNGFLPSHRARNCRSTGALSPHCPEHTGQSENRRCSGIWQRIAHGCCLP